MRLYYELARRSFQRYLTYRTAILAGVFTNFFFGLMRAAILVALLGDRGSVEGYTAQGLVTYAALTQAIIGFLAVFGWWELMNTVYSGEISADLLKPMNYFLYWLAQDSGRAFVNLIFRGSIVMIGYTFVFDLIWPTSVLQWLLVLLVIILAWLLSFAWAFFINLSSFWSPNAKGIGRFGFTIAMFASGFIMPLDFFPEWLQTILSFSPFPFTFDLIVRVFLGNVGGMALFQAILMQLGWIAILFLLCQLILRRGVRRLVILGG